MGIEGRERPGLPSQRLPGRGGDPGQRPVPVGPGRAQPRTQRPAPSLLPVRRASSSGPGPWCSPGAAGPRPGPEKAPRCPREARALSLPPRSPRPPRLRGSGAPSPAGVHSGLELRERRTERAPPRMAGLTAVGGLARGATRKLSAQVCVPWKKRLSLTMHKGEPPRPSPEKPGSGRGVAGGWGARRRGGCGRRRSLGRAG